MTYRGLFRGLFRPWAWSALAVCAGAVVLAPAPAEACSPPECGDSPRFLQLELGHAEVAPDGVIVFDTFQGNDSILPAEDVLDVMRVSVLDADEQPVPGTAEHDGGLYFWRPDAALAAGTTLSVSVNIDNDALDAKNECGLDAYGPFDLSVADALLPTLELPELGFASEYSVYPRMLLDTVVCCDGAYPQLQVGSCTEEVYWEEGYCVGARGVGHASALFDIANLDPLLATSLRVEILVDGEVTSSVLASQVGDSWGTSRPEAFEASLRFVSLVDGSSVQSVPALADGGQPDALGEIDLDVSAELEANCEAEAYTCAVDGEFGEAWDPQACEPWGDDGGTDSDTDGGTDSDTDGGTDTGGGSDSDSGGDSSGSDSDGDSSGSDSDTDGDADQDGNGGGGCNVDGRGTGGGWLLMLGLGAVPLLRRRRR